jgi:hypothetical protein
MKNLLKFLLLMCCTIVLASCDRQSSRYHAPDTDSVKIASIVEKVVNPTFTSVSALVEYQEADINQHRVGEVFRAMPDYILRSVATVCINRDKKVSKRSVVEEYLARADVYDNLASENEPLSVKEDVNVTVEEAPKNKNDSAVALKCDVSKNGDNVIRTVKDTIIDGELVTLISYNKK